MGAHAGPAAESTFGPAVIFAALVEADVRFRFVGFVTHYADELYHLQHPASPARDNQRPRTQDENRDRLARVLRELGATVPTGNGIPELFTGDGSALTADHQQFQTRHGDIDVYVHSGADQAGLCLDDFSADVQINITIPMPTLRSYVATGRFPRLDEVLEIFEVFDPPGADGDSDPRQP